MPVASQGCVIRTKMRTNFTLPFQTSLIITSHGARTNGGQNGGPADYGESKLTLTVKY